jgi:Spy/CpxP family protein refolding chaperone
MLRLAILAILALFVSVVPARAQRATTAAPGSRPALEQQFKERAAKLTQQRLGLTDAQLDKLEQSNARFAPQHRQLAVQDRDIRKQLRQEMTAGDAANQKRVSDLLDATLRLQKQRIALVESEQKDLAVFLTPVQRARYIYLQAQFRKRAQELTGQGPRSKQGLGRQQGRRPIGR